MTDNLFMRTILWSLAILLTMACAAQESYAEGDVFDKSAAKMVRCALPTHREQTPEQVSAGEPGDAFLPDDFSGYNAYLTRTMETPGNPVWISDPACNYQIDFESLTAGQHYIWFETVDTEARVSKRSEVYPFEVSEDTGPPKIIMPPNPPQLVVVGPGGPVATFGPVTAPAVFKSTPEIKSAKFMVVNAIVNSIGVRQGLVSRDESGQTEPGHVSVSVLADGKIRARNQGGVPGDALELTSVSAVVPGVPFTLALNVGPGGMQMYHDGVSVGYNPLHYPLSGNDLPLVVGGACWSCKPDNRTPSAPINGEITVELYDTEMILLGVGGVV